MLENKFGYAVLAVLILTGVTMTHAEQINLNDKLKQLVGGGSSKQQVQEVAQSPAITGPLRIGSLAAPEQNATEVEGRLRQILHVSKSDAVVPSGVAGIFAVGNSARIKSGNYCPMYVDGDLRVIANNGALGWTELETHTPLSDSQLTDLRQQIANSLAKSGLHLGPKNKQSTMLLISANDCPACIALEKILAAQPKKIPYSLASIWLDRRNAHFNDDVWCSQNPDQAWSDLLVNRKAPPSSSGRCPKLVSMERELDCLLRTTLPQGKGVPFAVFPDGSYSESSRDLIGRLNQSLASGAVFPGTESVE